MSDIGKMSDVLIGCRISDFGDISGSSSKFRTSWWIINIYPIHTQLIQNYINIFRRGILTLTFCIHSLNHYKNFSIAPTFMTNQHIGFFPKCRPTFQNVGWHIRFFLKCRPTFSKTPFQMKVEMSWRWGLENEISADISEMSADI